MLTKNSQMISWGACAAIVFCVAPASAEVANIFGLPLGGKFVDPVPQCHRMEQSARTWCATSAEITGTSKGVHWLLRPMKPEPDLKIPEWVVGGREEAKLRLAEDGELAIIEAKTHGPQAQAVVLQSIAGRFGEPTKREDRVAQNIQGGTWSFTLATWELPGLTITHDCYRRDRCMVTFMTDKGKALRQSDLEERKQKNAM